MDSFDSYHLQLLLLLRALTRLIRQELQFRPWTTVFLQRISISVNRGSDVHLLKCDEITTTTIHRIHFPSKYQEEENFIFLQVDIMTEEFLYLSVEIQ